MKRLLTTVVGLVAMLWLSSSTVWAGPQWCEEDPEFLVNGALVDVSTLFPGGYAQYVDGSVNFNLQVPSNVVAAVVSLPGTIPVTAQVSRTLPAYWGIGSIPVVLTVSMDSSVSFQTLTTITGLGGSVLNTAYGYSTWPTKSKFYMYGL
jgi:hypothetical protein